MAAKPLPEQAKALVGKLGSALPFLKPRLPGTERADEPFDTIEDGSSEAMDDFGPNAAPALKKAAGTKGASGGPFKGAAPEALKGFVEVVMRSKLAIGILLSALVLILAFCIVAIVVSAPVKFQASGSPATPEGAAMLHRLILPPVPGIEAHVELEREKDRVYTAQDASRFLTDPASVDLSGLEARNKAELDHLYGTVP